MSVGNLSRPDPLTSRPEESIRDCVARRGLALDQAPVYSLRFA